MSVEELNKKFDSEQACIAYLEEMRWPEGVRCLKCGNAGISRFQARGKTGKVRHLYQCVSCRYQFSVTTGTIFHDSHIPLRKWFLAIALLEESGKSNEELSINQLARALGVQYKSACHLVDRIREVLREGKQGTLGETEKADPGHLGEENSRQQERPPWEKRAFLGLMGARKQIEAVGLTIPSKSLSKTDRREIRIATELDLSRGEGESPIWATSKFWSLFKRGLTGSFAIASVPVVSVRHVPGFLNDLTQAVGGSFLSALSPGISRPAAKRKD